MISCTEFILAYNELFRFLHERYGREAVNDFWIYISDNFLANLDRLVREKGIQGMEEYWTRTLEEERADYSMDVSGSSFEIVMHSCPSVGILNEKGVEKYPYYCDHCDTLYRRVIEKYGFTYTINYIDREKGACSIKVVKNEKKD